MSEKDRYSRQTVLSELGKEGQDQLEDQSVTIIGLGALGSTMADTLVRSGVGNIKLVDRDFVDLSNLHRQTLYTEKDLGKPKAEVAAHRLKQINSEIKIEPKVQHVSARNIESIIENASLVLDATDNMKIRFILNDACVKHNTPWIYSAVIRTEGMNLFIDPGKGPCFRCIWQRKPEPGMLETCATAGILPTLPKIIGNIAVTKAIKYLIGEKPTHELLMLDVWKDDINHIKVSRNDSCPCCIQNEFPYLEKESEDTIVDLCGKNSIQVSPSEETTIELAKIADRYPQANIIGEILVRFKVNSYTFSLFSDGRAIIEGVNNPKKARSLYSEYVGR